MHLIVRQELLARGNEAFANINDDGEVVLSDGWADTDIHYPGDSWNDPPGCLYGNFKAIYNLKKEASFPPQYLTRDTYPSKESSPQGPLVHWRLDVFSQIPSRGGRLRQEAQVCRIWRQIT